MSPWTPLYSSRVNLRDSDRHQLSLRPTSPSSTASIRPSLRPVSDVRWRTCCRIGQWFLTFRFRPIRPVRLINRVYLSETNKIWSRENTGSLLGVHLLESIVTPLVLLNSKCFNSSMFSHSGNIPPTPDITTSSLCPAIGLRAVIQIRRHAMKYGAWIKITRYCGRLDNILTLI